MTRKMLGDELLKAWEVDANNAYHIYKELRSWLKNNHPEIAKEYENYLLLKVIQG